jgi:hypothetical protein
MRALKGACPTSSTPACWLIRNGAKRARAANRGRLMTSA